MNKVLFRVDGSFEIGLGHVFRCVSLAEGLSEAGIESVFCIKETDKGTSDIVEKMGFRVIKISEALGINEDARFTIKILKKEMINIVIFDIAHSKNMANLKQFERYLRQFVSLNRIIISIDDISQLNLTFDIRVIPYLGAEKHFKIESSKSKLLLGSDYFIFNKEFIEAANVVRVIKPKATKILITAGGSDPFGLTSFIINDIYKVVNNNKLSVRIVIGPKFSFNEVKKIKDALNYYKIKPELISGKPKIMSRLLLWADLAIIAGGLTKYEAAVTGTPAITISPFDREAEMVRYFETGGTLVNLGILNSLQAYDIANALNNLIFNQMLRLQMSKNGKNLFDTHGVSRIVSEIQNIIN